MAASDPSRIVCTRCGANNFSTQASCWKCSAPLSAGALPLAPSAVPYSNPAAASRSSAYSPAPSAAPERGYPVNPSVANWSAILLGILFPFVAVPVGLVFMMFDDRRRTELGRITLVWGVIATVVQGGFTVVALGGTIAAVRSFVDTYKSAGAGQSQSPNSIVPSADIPPTFPR